MDAKVLFVMVAVSAAMFLSGIQAAEAGNLYCDSAGWLRCDNGAFYNVFCSNYCIVSQCDDGRNTTTDTCAPIPTSPPVPRGQGCNAGLGSCPNVCTYVSCPANKFDANDNSADGCEADTINYALTLDPSSGVSNKGDVRNVNATLTRITGSPSATISATGAPSGTTVSFSPTSCSPNCYSNVTVTTTSSTPIGLSTINILATAGSLVKSSTYGLTVLPDSCNNNAVCEYPETQSSCTSDCSTTATMPSPVTPGEIVSVSVEFYDFRYLASGKVRMDISIDGTTTWNTANGCTIGGVKLGPSSGAGTTAWPSGTTSEDGHFKITALCAVPSSLSAGAHTLTATPTIY